MKEKKKKRIISNFQWKIRKLITLYVQCETFNRGTWIMSSIYLPTDGCVCDHRGHGHGQVTQGHRPPHRPVCRGSRQIRQPSHQGETQSHNVSALRQHCRLGKNFFFSSAVEYSEMISQVKCFTHCIIVLQREKSIKYLTIFFSPLAGYFCQD